MLVDLKIQNPTGYMNDFADIIYFVSKKSRKNIKYIRVPQDNMNQSIYIQAYDSGYIELVDNIYTIEEDGNFMVIDEKIYIISIENIFKITPDIIDVLLQDVSTNKPSIILHWLKHAYYRPAIDSMEGGPGYYKAISF